MATIEQYQSGWVCGAVRQSVTLLRQGRGPIEDPDLLRGFARDIDALWPRRLTLEEAEQRIGGSHLCAVGHRMCHGAFHDVPNTTAVFLDALAEGLVAVGRARMSDAGSAVRLLQEQPRHPLVLTRVGGCDGEICPTVPARCFYWNLQRRRFKVFDRRDEPESARTNAC